MHCKYCDYDALQPGDPACPKCGMKLKNDTLLAGTPLKQGQYIVERVLGAGGFGVTYLCKDNSHSLVESWVAIKEYFPVYLAGRHSDSVSVMSESDRREPYAAGLERFRQEGEILRDLQGTEGIVRVLDVFDENNTAYLVMEYLQGFTLRQNMAQTWSMEQVRSLMGKLVAALANAHASKVYHLDIKPENIMMCGQRVVLIDFGASRREAEADHRSSSAFSLPYAAPEVLDIHQKVGPQSDIYSCGVLLYRLLKGINQDLPPRGPAGIGDASWPPGLAEPWRTLVEKAVRHHLQDRPDNIKTEWWDKQPCPGEDIVYDLKIKADEAANGCIKTVCPASGQDFEIEIPPGTGDGLEQRFPGKGQEGKYGGAAGALIVRFHVEPVTAPPEENVSGGFIIPELGQPKPSLGRDPVRRMQFTATTKWLLLTGVLLLTLWLPLMLRSSYHDLVHERSDEQKFFYLAIALVSALWAGMIATGLPRTILPNAFGMKWRDAADALRDWLAVGLCAGVLYLLVEALLKQLGLRADAATKPIGESFILWLQYKLPPLIPCALAGLYLARRNAVQREDVMGDASPAVQLGVQTVLVCALGFLLHHALANMAAWVADEAPWLPTLLLLASLALIGISAAIVAWAYGQDRQLAELQRRFADQRGTVNTDGGVELVIAIIGGRESGKTTLMAGAFWEWTKNYMGLLSIEPVKDAHILPPPRDPAPYIPDVATSLYSNRDFPMGNVSYLPMTFDLKMKSERVARFHLLDYPGGALRGQVLEKEISDRFWEYVDKSDGLVMIADASYMRRGLFDNDFAKVMETYKTVMQRVAAINGASRVVPIAMVLTKADEYYDPYGSGEVNQERVRADLERYGYLGLRQTWMAMVNDHGPRYAEFALFASSAITNSTPVRDMEGNHDLSQPFRPRALPAHITPSGCAAPLMWMTSQVMRWNITMFRDLKSFLVGSNGREQARLDAILELERIAAGQQN